MTTAADRPAWLARMDDPDRVLGSHINALRGFKICTQGDLAEAIGVSQSTMSKKLRGEVGITWSELLMLATFFEMAVEDMIPPMFTGLRPTIASRMGTTEERARRDSNPQPSDPEPVVLRLINGPRIPSPSTGTRPSLTLAWSVQPGFTPERWTA